VSSPSTSTTAELEQRKLRRDESRPGWDNLLGDWYRAFWEVMIALAPIHYSLLYLPEHPFAKGAAALVAYVALVLAVGLFAGGWISRADDWPNYSLASAGARLVAYNGSVWAAMAGGVVLRAYPPVGAAWAIAAPVVGAAAVPLVTRLLRRLPRW
jgi:hypothetical protein